MWMHLRIVADRCMFFSSQTQGGDGSIDTNTTASTEKITFGRTCSNLRKQRYKSTFRTFRKDIPLENSFRAKVRRGADPDTSCPGVVSDRVRHRSQKLVAHRSQLLRGKQQHFPLQRRHQHKFTFMMSNASVASSPNCWLHQGVK